METDLVNNRRSIIAADSIVKHFGKVHAVDGLSFEVRRGEIYGLLGPNGAGKTTTIKMLLGLLEPDAGTITIMNMDPQKDEVELKHKIGYVSEEPLIYKSLTAKELFNFVASIRGLSGPEVSDRLAQYLESLNALDHYNKLIQTLSHGNKQKIQIIAAILHNPELLIMDEPLNGLDAKAVKVVKEILDLHKKRGGSVVFSTHIMEIAEDICDRIAIINKGKLVTVGTMEELRLHANKTGASLEEIFLKLTEQDESVQNIIEKLRKTIK